jgi:hypothetical protein
MKKLCNKCRIEKPLSEFYEAIDKRYGKERKIHRTVCKICDRKRKNEWDARPESMMLKREKHLKSKYGISISEYESLSKKQNHQCAICKTSTPGGRYNVFQVDHSHEDGSVRGLLCCRCNMGIGYLNEDIQYFTNAIQYLEQSKQLQ